MQGGGGVGGGGGGPMSMSVADATRRRTRFEAEATQADTIFAAPTRTFAHPDSRGIVIGDMKTKLMEVACASLATGDDLSDAQQALLARYGVSLAALAATACVGGANAAVGTGASSSETPSGSSVRGGSAAASASSGRGPVWLDTGVHAATSGHRSPPNNSRKNRKSLISPSVSLPPPQIPTLQVSGEEGGAQQVLSSRYGVSSAGATLTTSALGGGAGSTSGNSSSGRGPVWLDTGVHAATSGQRRFPAINRKRHVTALATGGGYGALFEAAATVAVKPAPPTPQAPPDKINANKLLKLEKRVRRLTNLTMLPPEMLSAEQLLSFKDINAIHQEIAALKLGVKLGVEGTSTLAAMLED